MCSHDSKRTLKEAFIGPARCGLPFLNVPAGPFLPNPGPKSSFPISGLCSSDRPAPCKGLSPAKSGGYTVKGTTFHLLPSLHALDHHHVPCRPCIRQIRTGRLLKLSRCIQTINKGENVGCRISARVPYFGLVCRA